MRKTTSSNSVSHYFPWYLFGLVCRKRRLVVPRQPSGEGRRQIGFDVRMPTAEAPRAVERLRLAGREVRAWRRQVLRLVSMRRPGFGRVAPGVGLGLVVGRAMGIVDGGGCVDGEVGGCNWFGRVLREEAVEVEVE